MDAKLLVEIVILLVTAGVAWGTIRAQGLNTRAALERVEEALDGLADKATAVEVRLARVEQRLLDWPALQDNLRDLDKRVRHVEDGIAEIKASLKRRR